MMQLDVIHVDADECLLQWTTWVDAVFVHISHEINNQQCLGKYGLSFLNLIILDLRVYMPFLHRPITAMGDIFQWVVRFQPRRCLGIFLHLHFFARQVLKKIAFNLKWWQLHPKIYPRDFIDFWFNCVGVLNHVKVTLSKPFTHGMKSVFSKLIGPLSCLSFVNDPRLLCDCFRAAAASNWKGQQGPPRTMAGCKNINKQKNRVLKMDSQCIWYCSRMDIIWTQGHIVLPVATSAVLVHVDTLTSTLTVHVEVTFPTYSMAAMDLYHSWAGHSRGSW